MTAMRNGKPDRVPIRPLVGEFTAKYAGYTCQQVTHDYRIAFDAVCKTAADFEWDAVAGNMVSVWTGLTQAIGLRYFGVPGLDVDPDTGFQYREPPEAEAFMKPEENDELIEDPTAFLFNTWLPRVAEDVSPMGAPTSYRNNLSFVKGGMAMLLYLEALNDQTARLRRECGMPAAITGVFKAPLDIIADKLRGYIGLTMDLFERPDKVLAACEALMPHLYQAGLSSSDPEGAAPIAFWMHRGCVPFISHDQFDQVYWPTVKPLSEELWKQGRQTLFHAEANWEAHLDAFAELPARSIIYHVDQGDIFHVHERLGGKFCLSGGLPNYLLAVGTPDEVRARCRAILDGVAQDGGYIMDASGIVQNDATIENVRAMTEFTREYGVYRADGTCEDPADPLRDPVGETNLSEMSAPPTTIPGVCIPWQEKREEIPEIRGDEAIVERVWDDIEGLAYTYIWRCLLSF